MSAAVAWISRTPVKGLRLLSADEVSLTRDGVPGDRAFFLVDPRNRMVSATRVGPLVAVVPEHDAVAGTLALRFPDGHSVAERVRLGEPEEVGFYDERLRVRPVLGPFSAELSRHCGTSLRLFATPPERPGIDRGSDGAVTLLSTASLDRLRAAASVDGPVDPRRFRMTFGVDGLEAHEEDGWMDRDVRIGGAVLRVAGHVGRCALTTRQPETGVVDFKTLHHLRAYRGEVEATEPLPFGVHARVLEPGRVRIGDTVSVV